MTTTSTAAGNADQIAFWNGVGGDAWTERQQAQDALLAPISALLLDAAAASSGEGVIDIGCGCGATSLDLARAVGSSGHVLGIDVSHRMLARAAERMPPCAPIEFIEADATSHHFAAGSADLLVSRFGVMFFADPVTAFANLRQALKPGGRLAFVCWREPRLNPWAMAPLQAAYAHVPRLPPTGPEDPGLFSFASEERVRRILGAAGFVDVEMTIRPIEFDLAGGQGLDAAVASVLEFGPTKRALEGQPPDKCKAAAASVREALAPYAKGATVPLPGSIWLVTARNP